MTEQQELSLPIPAIVIAIGDFAEKAVEPIRRIYLRGDERRKLVTAFLTVIEEEDALELTPLDAKPTQPKQEGEDCEEEESKAPKAGIERQLVFQKVLEQAGKLRNELEQNIFDIQAHQLLIQAGWAEAYDVPVNLYLMADVKDPQAAGKVFPLLCLMEDISININLCKVHILLNTAVFPSGIDSIEANRDVEVYSFLAELNDLLGNELEHRKKLGTALGCDYRLIQNTNVYLFDSHKEGSYAVKENDQMEVMIGNALLALMQDDLARRATGMHDLSEAAERHSYYSSIGSSALLYDPESLQNASSSLVAHEFLEDVILCRPGDAQTAADEFGKIEREIGDLRDWQEHCLQKIPAVGQIQIDPETAELSILLVDLKLTKMDYELLRATPWVQQIQDCSASIEKNILPSALETIEQNAKRMGEALGASLQAAIEALPSTPNLYPGGIVNAQQTLTFLTEYFSQESKKITELQGLLQEKKGKVGRDLEQTTTQIQKIFDHAPKLPWFVRILPRFVRDWAAPIFYAWRYGKQIIDVRNLAAVALKLLQAQTSIQLQTQALDQICMIVEQLGTAAEAGKTDYIALEEKLQSALGNLPADWPAFPFGQAENDWEEAFRIPVVEPSLAEWAYNNYHPSLEKWVYELIEEGELLRDWRHTAPEAILQKLVDKGQTEYAQLWKISLDQVFQLWAGEKPELVSDQPFSSSTILTCINAAIPLLKPDFDASGGSGLSSISSHVLVGRPEWEYFQAPSELPGLKKIDMIYTGDPYTGLFIQIRHLVPLQSLVYMIRSGQRKFDGLSEAKKQEYGILKTIDGGVSYSSDEVDETDPDILHKSFHWKFQPRGSGTSSEFTITLDISRSRFERYKRKQRYRGEWNRYAEEEMPEIRALANEFQKIHAERRWNTYNQAANVLNFVQGCIPYSFDKDTTGYEDWARYPIETLMDGTGDCEDVAILCASVIARLGFQVVLLLYPRHLAFGVAGADKLKGDYIRDPSNSRRYYYGEATASGWYIGKIPESYRNIEPEQILPVNILIDEDGENTE